MAEQQISVAVLGGGSFGTALASIAADNGARVRQWMRDETLVTQINREHRNGRYLPHYAMNPAVEASTDFQAVLADAELVLIAIPSKAFRSVVQAAKGWLRPEQILVSTTKGIEQDGFLLMSQVLEQETGYHHVGVIAGPNLASEIADKQLTATVIASADPLTRTRVQQALGCGYFRVYASNDRHGVELAGALKNIYAIAAGMAAALGMGENTRSMLMTRALAEMSRFAVAQGANPMTFLGLAGVGDLIVTCSSNLSRNYRVGYAMGEGRSLEEAVDALGQVAEGVNTVKLVCAKAREMGVYMPLAEGLSHVLFGGVAAKEMARTLMMGEQSSDVEFILPREAVQQAHQDQAPHNQALTTKLLRTRFLRTRFLRTMEAGMPDVLIMRHGEAAPGYPDQARRLTPHGEQEAEKMARWLTERVAGGELLMPRIYASPYARAQQTAQTLCGALGTSLETLGIITPDDSPSAVSDWLLEQPEGAPIMLVSHMPLVGDLTGLLVEGSSAQGAGFPTAAIAELEADVWASGCARLKRFTQPGQLA